MAGYHPLHSWASEWGAKDTRYPFQCQCLQCTENELRADTGYVCIKAQKIHRTQENINLPIWILFSSQLSILMVGWVGYSDPRIPDTQCLKWTENLLTTHASKSIYKYRGVLWEDIGKTSSIQYRGIIQPRVEHLSGGMGGLLWSKDTRHRLQLLDSLTITGLLLD